ncbi:MAG: NAD-dependent epimerase/dehydratase family protein [Planctomycetes bacterium]|nr:NAD-dependent epimerase/dehydratase family protein [Planctomycetota bacterium]
MSYLVTGGCGFIGSHITAKLAEQGHKVRVVDDLSTGFIDNIAGLDVELIVGDLSDPDIAFRACENIDHIYHLAARPSVPFSIEHPELAYQANHQSTLSLITAATECGAKTIVFSSSSAVYGDEPTLPKTEDCSLAPMSPYAEHKLAGEQALAECPISSVALRYFNVFGPKQDPSSPYSGVISLFSKWASESKAANMYGDGLQTRDFVFVDDVVNANLSATAYAESTNGSAVINIATGKAITIVELWNHICDITEFDGAPKTHLAPRDGDIRDSVADISRAQQLLNYKVQTKLIDGLKSCLENG